MTDLLDFLTTAHGGLDPWSNATAVAAKVDIYGPTWKRMGHGNLLGPCDVLVETNRQHVVLRSEQSGFSLVFDGDLDRVTVRSGEGQTVEVLDRPRKSLLGTDMAHPWSAAQVGYFAGYGVWSYLLEPFLFHQPGVLTTEVEPWQERGETWRRLEVTFPESMATHESTYIYHFDSATGMQRRMDYAPAVLGGRLGAHYTFEHRIWDGVAVPTGRRVLVRDSGGKTDQHQVPILLDVNDFRIIR